MFVVEPTASLEKLTELLAEAHESSALDYKATLDLNSNDQLVELVKDLAAMRGDPLGGYVLVGSDDHGQATDGLANDEIAVLFDEARLRSKVQKYLTEPLQLLCGVHIVDGHRYALIYINGALRGFEVLRLEGMSGGRLVFQAGDVFVRRGTSSVRWNSEEAEQRLSDFADGQREAWRREMREDLGAILPGAVAGQRVSQGPADAFTWQLDANSFGSATIELMRANDDVVLRRFLLRVPAEASRLLEDGDQEGVGALLDRLTHIGAIAIELERSEWLERVMSAYMRVYELGIDKNGVSRANDVPYQQLWLALLSRAYGMGALAVRLRHWAAIPLIATPLPEGNDFDYYFSWLRHSQVNAARDGLLDDKNGVIPTAHNEIRRLPFLHPDATADDERVLSSLCQFDLLAAVTVADARRKISDRGYYTNFAPFWSSRTIPAFELLIRDARARSAIAPELSDSRLAQVLAMIARMASREGTVFRGFDPSDSPSLEGFLRDHLTEDPGEARERDLG